MQSKALETEQNASFACVLAGQPMTLGGSVVTRRDLADRIEAYAGHNLAPLAGTRYVVTHDADRESETVRRQGVAISIETQNDRSPEGLRALREFAESLRNNA